MAEDAETPKEIAEEEHGKDQHDAVVQRRSKPHLRFGKSLRVAAAIALGSVIGPSTPQAPSSITERPPGIESVVTINRELPPFPEFSPAENQRIIVIPIKDADEKEAFSSTEIEAMLARAKTFLEKNSKGKSQVTFELLPWQVVDSLPTDRVHEIDPIAEKGNKALEDAGVPGIDSYSTRMYLYHGIPLTGADYFNSGAGYARKGTPNKIWITDGQGDDTDGVIEHEVAHIFGLPHDHSQTTSGQLLIDDYTNNIHVQEIKGESLMGIVNLGDVSIPGKISMGWVTEDRVASVSMNGEYTLSPHDVEDPDGLLALRIRKPDTDEFFYVEYRQPREDIDIGRTGLQFRIWDEQLETPTRQVQIQHSLPHESGYVEDGDTFRDKLNGINITQISHDEKGVRVKVTFDN